MTTLAKAASVGAGVVAISMVRSDLVQQAPAALAELRAHLGADTAILLGGGAATRLVRSSYASSNSSIQTRIISRGVLYAWPRGLRSGASSREG